MKKFIYKTRITQDRIDINNHLNSLEYQKIMFEAANVHSLKAGFDIYKEVKSSGNSWILKEIKVEYIKEVFLDQEVEVQTFIERNSLSSSKRYFEIYVNEALVCKAHMFFIYFNIFKKRPLKIPDELFLQYIDF